VRETARCIGPADLVHALAVVADGRLASGSRDGTIRLWDVMTGADAARLNSNDAKVYSLAVLPDGRLASGAADRCRLRWSEPASAREERWESGGSVCLNTFPRFMVR
jgi:WD40 repeat protein